MIKQVIIIRRDLNLRRGKEIAQGAHASIAFLTEALFNNINYVDDTVREWLESGETKICLQIRGEAEIYQLYKKAKDRGLRAHLIRDLAKTELKKPTYTALAIGPNKAKEIDPLTHTLKLY